MAAPGYTVNGRAWPPKLAVDVSAVHIPGFGPDHDRTHDETQRLAAQVIHVTDVLW